MPEIQKHVPVILDLLFSLNESYSLPQDQIQSPYLYVTLHWK